MRLFSAYLILGVRFEEKNIDNVELVHVTLALELLPYPGADGGSRHGHVVQGLDLRSLV